MSTVPAIQAPETPPEVARSAARMKTGGGAAAFWRKVGAIMRKDLRAEFRGREVFPTMASFSVLAVIVFGLAFDLRVPEAEMVAPGVLWVVILFGGVLGLNRTFGAEADRGTLAALLLAPVDRSAIYFGKFFATLLLTLATEALVLPVILIIFDVNLFHAPILLGVLLGTVGYVGVGTLFAALTASSRARESMLPILLLPVMVPIFTAGVGLASNVLDGRTWADVSRWLLLMGGYDAVFLTVAYLVFDLIWEEA